MNELKWEPFLTSSEIGVAVKNGIVTLSGHLDSYAKKVNAERAAKRVAGVKAIAEDIQVGVSPVNQRSDTEIAEAAMSALKWHEAVQEDKIKIKVEDRMIKLEGEVEWEYQRKAAQNSVQYLSGIKGVINEITVKPRISARDLEQKITAAFQRHANFDAAKIHVSVIGNRVILNGKVRSFAESEDAEDAAWAAPGVQRLENNLTVEEPELVY